MASSDSSNEAAVVVASWDLTNRVSPYLDLHMMFPLLEYVDSLINEGMIAYDSSDVAAARLSLLRPTHMVDYAMDIYRELHGDDNPIPQEMEDQKAAVFVKLEELRNASKPLDDLLSNQDQKSKLVKEGKWNVKDICAISDNAITVEVVETYRQLAKFNFDCGDYQSARDMLEQLISLYASPPLPKEEKKSENDDETNVDDITAEGEPQENKKEESNATAVVGNPNMYYLTQVNNELLGILWGKLACEILGEKWEEASVALTAVKTAMEGLATSNKLSALEALKQRTWLLHWSLFVYWNSNSTAGLEQMVELFFTERYLQAITTNAPHLLRYLTAAVLLCKRRLTAKQDTKNSNNNNEARKLLKDLVKVMQHCEYTDPIVEFVDCLCVKFDFEGAQTKLAECEVVLSTDFFLCKQTALFMEEARVFVFENYCRIHNKIDLTALGEKLAMDQESAERWIVDLIRHALLDAKIDSQHHCVVMGNQDTSMVRQIMDRTKDLQTRSIHLVQNLKTVLNDAKKEKIKRARQAAREREAY